MSRTSAFAVSALFLVISAASCGGDDVTIAPKDGGATAFDVTVPGPAADGGDAGPGDLPFPAVTGQQHITGLKGAVDVLRDKYGVVHIYATTAEDAFRVQGYQVALDRTFQVEFLRRIATGRIAEILGDQSPSLIDQDITIRSIGLPRVAKQMYDALAPDVKAWVDAYADGVSQWNARVVAGQEHYPDEMFGIRKQIFEPWTGADVLAVERLLVLQQSTGSGSEISFTKLVQAVKTTFAPGAVDPNLAKRAGLPVDLFRFAPLDPATAMDGLPNDTGLAKMPVARSRKPAPSPTSAVQAPRIPAATLAATEAFNAALEAAGHVVGDRPDVGSNNWVVGPSLTATGHAMLASDPHLSLSAPSTWWMVHINVSDPKQPLNFEGVSFPGVFAAVIGINDSIAWAATDANYDVTDVYQETLTADGSGVVFKGQPVPFTKQHEKINIAGGGSYEWDVLIVPHHGYIIPNIGADHAVHPPLPSSLSVRWTGDRPTTEVDAIVKVIQAKNVEDARSGFRKFSVAPFNWVVADTHGDIFYTSQSQIPLRDKAAYTWNPATYSGTLPCMILPGDGTAEWTGKFMDEANVPHVKNPPKHYVGTANGDPYGGLLDNDPSNDKLPNGDPIYTGCFMDTGFRVGRVHERIETVGHPITMDDMAAFQADAKSPFGRLLAPKLLDAIAHAQAEKTTPGSHPDLTALVTSARYSPALIAEVADALGKWKTDSDYDAAAGVSLDDDSLLADAKEATASKATAIFNLWKVAMVWAVLGDEWTAMGNIRAFEMSVALANVMLPDPTTLKTYDATLKDSILFDDLATAAVTETRDQRAILALLDTLDELAKRLGSDTNGWRWGKLHRVRFDSIIPLWPTLSIPPPSDPIFPDGFPRHGDGYNIDVANVAFARTLAATQFHYTGGPSQRLVVDMTPTGPVARNVLPGGEVWYTTSKHMRDEAERWRKNQNRPMPFARADVIAEAEDHLLWTSP